MPSQVVRAFLYDPASRRLVVSFVNGRRYAYLEVPEATYHEMRRTSSKGRFLNAVIKPRFQAHRLGDANSAIASGGSQPPGPRVGPE